MKKENLIGKKFNRLTVLSERIRTDVKKKAIYWLCICDCGKEKVVTSYNLKSGHTQSCGCLQKEKASHVKLIDISGQKFGRLTVIKRATMDHQPKWFCKCDCGNETIIQGVHLKSGHTQSCGCLSIEVSIEKIKKFWDATGKEHPSYNPNISDEEREKGRFLHKEELKKWRMGVFSRDNFTCVICNKRGVTLHAHHLDGYNWNKEKRFDLNNGVTLCSNCHTSFHKKYGYGNNTKQQFEEYRKTSNTQSI